MIGLSKTELAAAEVIIAWRSTRSSLSQRKSGTWRRGAVTMDAGKEGRASMYARYDQTGTCAPLLILSKRWGTIVMESCVTRECHAQFGERDRETRLLRRRKVRSVPTPLSPVLANMTLDGLERRLRERFPKTTVKGIAAKVNFVRYADDFIVTAASKEVLEHEVKPLVEAFMKERGLELSSEKTCITHIEDGFDFLGQNVRKYKTGKQYKLLLKPAQKNVHAHLEKLRDIIKKHHTLSAGRLILLLNPIIRGWAPYHQHVVSADVFHDVDDAIYRTLRWWMKRRHPKKSNTWITKKYFKTVEGTNWVFYGEVEGQEYHLAETARVPIKRHAKVKSEANPYDPAWESYYEQRLDVHMADTLKGKRWLFHLWNEQNGLCPLCQQKITKLTGWHSHHVAWRSKGGPDTAENRVLLHPNCHQQLHSQGLHVEKPRPAKGVGKA